MQRRKQILSLVTALGLGLSLGWLLPAQEASPWKDRAEYDLYEAYTKAKDVKGKVDALDKWKQAYPDSKLAQQREDEYLTVYTQAKDNRKAFDTAKALRAKNPNHFFATTTILQLIYQMGNPPSAPDLATAEETAKYVVDNLEDFFAPANKPANIQDAQWTSYKPNLRNVAMRTYAWIFVQRKDDVRAEVELTKVLEADPTLAQFSQFLATAQFNQRQVKPEKQVTALFHYTRAASYTGQNELPANVRQQLTTFVGNAYEQFHGSRDGLNELMALAKANVMPPPGFTIKNKNELAAEDIARDEEWKKAHPDLAIWRDTIKNPLLAEDGAAYFESTIKDAKIPGGINGVDFLKGTIISLNPPTRPKQLVVAVYDPALADATLEFEEPLPGDMPAGSVIEFAGTGKSYTKEPFNVTFEVEREDLKGWTGVDQTKGKAKAAPKGKAPAAKGKGK